MEAKWSGQGPSVANDRARAEELLLCEFILSLLGQRVREGC